MEISDDFHLKSLLLEQMSHVVFAVDPLGRIVFWNRAAENILGYSREEAVGHRPTELLVKDDQAALQESIRSHLQRGQSWRGELLAQRKDGTTFPSEVTIDPIWDHTGRMLGAVCVGSDVTARKEAESMLRHVLDEKEVLLKEVHHRVKNNLQVVSSLLHLQSKTINDPKMIELLRESQNRIRSVTLIHEKLYQTQEFARIRLSEYVKSLSTYLLESYGATASVKLMVNVDRSIQLDSETSMLCGLIISELVSNALKHAFPDGQRGEIRIDLSSAASGEISLKIQDNGRGLPPDVDIANSPSLGLKLVHALVNQLKGNLVVDRERGTRITITFAAKT